jgi:uncharacterized small protein (DUF1192 family)
MSRLDALKRKLAARDGKPEFVENCAHLRAEIERLEADGKLATFMHENEPEADGS